jgi:hypothetical protein
VPGAWAKARDGTNSDADVMKVRRDVMARSVPFARAAVYGPELNFV